jgi:probable DNA repair protein
LSACAQWCLRRLEADGTARLLVLTACTQPSLAVQGELLWRELSGGAGDSDDRRNSVLAIEGGTPLHQAGLVADALVALGCMAAEVDTQLLLALLRSPYLKFGTQQELWSLQGSFEKWGMARWPMHSLRQALDGIAIREPAAAKMSAWLQTMERLAESTNPQRTTEWARRFSEGIAAAGFHRGQGLDSREQQRLERWSELLDEFAGLDAVIAPMDSEAALRRLRQLAAESRHQAASGDAAITLSASLHDPVVHYDGIWVLGLAETRFPAPPRPDAYIAVQEQRRHHWPESSVTGRHEQAQWAMSRWQLRTPELVLSHPAMEGDLRHRPTSLLAPHAAPWQEEQGEAALPALGHSRPFPDQQFPPVAAPLLEKALTGGVERLRVQRDCAFRAQAQWRLKAMAPEPFSDGLTAPARGTLLHRLLEGVWGELRDQSQLLSMNTESEAALLARHWNEAIAGDAIPAARWWPAGLRERERARTLAIMSEVLQLERARAPFTVQARELKLQWPASGARLNLRIDRVDATEDGGRVLLDYKSGAAGRMKLHEGELEPLQLALYVAALAARGESVVAAALFSLKPGEVGISGIASPDVALPGMKPLGDWPAAAAQWQRGLLQLLSAHLEGSSTLAQDPATCRHCHLPALCRRVALEDVEEGADD